MGNSSKKPAVHIQLDAQSYFGGEEVTGQVFLNCPVPIDSKQLWFSIKGKETCEFNRQQGEGRARGRQILTAQSFPIFESDSDKIPIGNYAIPFSFALPENIPGTFVIQDSNTRRARIKYTIQVKSNGQGKNQVKDKIEVVIKQRIRGNKFSIVKDIREPVMQFCCIHKGFTTFSTRFDKNAYSPDEDPMIIIEVDNSQCQVQIQYFNIAFWREIGLTSDHGDVYNEKISLFNHQINGVPANQALLSDSAIHAHLPLSKYSHMIENACGTLGSKIQCFYFISVEANMGSMSSTHPSVESYTMIHAIDHQQRQLPEAPADWNPIVLPAATMTLPEPSAPTEPPYQ